MEGIRVLTLGPLNLVCPLFGTHHVAGSLSSFSLQFKILSHSSSFSLHMRVQAHEVWRPEDNLGCHPQKYSPSFSERRSLTQMRLSSKFPGSFCLPLRTEGMAGLCHHVWCFCTGSGFHAFKASSLLTDLSPAISSQAKVTS